MVFVQVRSFGIRHSFCIEETTPASSRAAHGMEMARFVHIRLLKITNKETGKGTVYSKL